MKQIRHSVFETNSSSSHSISISKKGNIENVQPNKSGIIFIKLGEFGWEEKEYHDFETKASYLATSLCYNLFSDEQIDKLKEHNLWDEKFNNFGRYNFDYGGIFGEYSGLLENTRDFNRCISLLSEKYIDLVSCISEQTLAEEVLILPVDSYFHIDHQSIDVPDDAFNGDLRNYLFNKQSILVTDNDNHY